MATKLYYNYFVSKDAEGDHYLIAKKLHAKKIDEHGQTGHYEHFAKRKIRDAVEKAKDNQGASSFIGYAVVNNEGFCLEDGMMSKSDIFEDFPFCIKIKEELL